MMRSWVAVCTTDLDFTRFNMAVEAPNYTLAIAEAYYRLHEEHPEAKNTSAVLEIIEKSST